MDSSKCSTYPGWPSLVPRKAGKEGLFTSWKSRLVSKCDSTAAAPSLILPTSTIKRASLENLRPIFDKYASIHTDGVPLMTYADFVQRFLGLLDTDDYNESTMDILGQAVDRTRQGYITFEDFHTFEGVLCQPDSLYRLAFSIFDQENTGSITFKMFTNILRSTLGEKFVPFNFDSNFVKLHFGKNKDKTVSYEEFTQILHEYHEEQARQAFEAHDKNSSGSIHTDDLCQIMGTLKHHLLTQYVELSIAELSETNNQQVSYAFFLGLVDLLNNMELVKKIYTTITKGTLTREVTKEEFLQHAQQFSKVTPMEVSILFKLAAVINKSGKITFKDLENFSPLKFTDMPYRIQAHVLNETVAEMEESGSRGTLMVMLESAYRFFLGAIAGATGATAVYPIDLVKTRMQNQRSVTMVGELMYKHSLDCFQKVVRFEGLRGLYRGLGPQLMGVAPEKAIKLTMNDLMRGVLSKPDNSIPFWAECLSGGIAGASQVMFTNPLEIVKIRLQVAGEVAAAQRPGAIQVVKELGFLGLYKGARACLLRDIPFSAIYFPAYAHFKKYNADENGYNSPLTLLVSAFLAGAPAAFLVTPADVIKTRLQVSARAGQTTYSGIIDCSRKIMAEEGFRAFWKGSIARVCRSSPQFAVTLVTYEMLQRIFYVPFGRKPEGSSKGFSAEDYKPANAHHIGGFRYLQPTFNGIESQFGLCFPRFRSAN